MHALSPTAIVEEFQETRRKSDLRDKMPEPLVVPNGPVVELILIAVLEKHQGKGYATRALEMLMALCDRNEVTLQLTARRMDDSPLSHFAPGCPATRTTDELASWYRGHGFVEITPRRDEHAHDMERKPSAPAVN